MTLPARLIAESLSAICRHSGLVFKDVRLTSTVEAIERWIVDAGIDSISQIGRGPAFDTLLEQVVVHESYFDRDLDQLRMIDETVFAPRAHSQDSLRVWSAGCAGGEEAYTLAFMLQTRGLLQRTAITATDISRLALARARAGRYRAWSLRTGDQTPAMRYLWRDGKDLCVPASIKGAIDFRPLNLLEDDYPAEQDLVLCRNVLIYLEPDAVARVAVKLAGALAADGWLFVAPSDPRLDRYAALDATVTDRGVCYRRSNRTARAAAPLPVSSDHRVLPPRPWIAPVPKPRPIDSPRPALPVSEIERATRLADRGDYAGARSVVADALAVSPLNAELHFLSAVLAADDDIAATLAALDRAMYLAPEIPASYLFAGRIHESRGDATAARRAYRGALRILEALLPDAPVPWADEPARLLTAACRQALESLDDR